jgi:hypothetical protein
MGGKVLSLSTSAAHPAEQKSVCRSTVATLTSSRRMLGKVSGASPPVFRDEGEEGHYWKRIVAVFGAQYWQGQCLLRRTAIGGHQVSNCRPNDRCQAGGLASELTQPTATGCTGNAGGARLWLTPSASLRSVSGKAQSYDGWTLLGPAKLAIC